MKIDLEPLIQAGEEAWDIWRDGNGVLHASLSGVNLLPELELFAKAVAAKCAELCAARGREYWDHEGPALACADAIREAFGLEKA